MQKIINRFLSALTITLCAGITNPNAAQRPGLHPVSIKTINQQDIQLLHRLRQRQVQHSTALADQHRCLLEVRQAMATFLQQIEELAAQHPAYINLLPLPGIGPMIASAYIAAIGNGRQFKCGCQVSAWLGLVPRQYGTGGKIQLKRITKNGDRYLRTLMIYGARAVITRGLKTRPELAQWVQPIIDRQGFNTKSRRL